MGGYVVNGSYNENISMLKAKIGINLGLFKQELNVLHKGYLYYLGDKSPENQLCYEFWQKRQLYLNFKSIKYIADSFEKGKIDTAGRFSIITDYTKADIFNRVLVENLLYILLLLDNNSTLAEFISKNPDTISQYNNDRSGLTSGLRQFYNA